MSQPTDRFKDLAPVGNLDESRGEFWIANPWKVPRTRRNLSAFEPNQVFLNLTGGSFADIGYLTTADSDGDGRGVMVADVTGDLQPDLLVLQSGGGPLRVYANRFPPASRLVVSLDGTVSNRLGIGATVVAEVDGRRIVRQMLPTHNFSTSQGGQVRFGLGQARVVDRLVVNWPSGTVQEFRSVQVGVHIRITEDQPEFEVLFSGEQQRDRSRMTALARDTRTDSELASPVGSPAGSASTTRGQLNNLAVIKIGQKEYAAAERLLRQAIAQSPSYPSPHYNLRRIYVETQRYDEADRELWIAVDKGLRDPKRTLDQAAADYEDLSLLDRAAALLTEALTRFPEHEPFWVHLMVVRIRLEQCAEGQELGARAAPKFPESAPVHAFYGVAAACIGDLPTARAELSRSLELNPDQATLRETLDSLPASQP